MAIQFCPVCKSLLEIKEIESKIWSVCKCGFRRPSAIELGSVDKTALGKLSKIGEGVIEKEDKNDTEKLTYNDKKEMKSEF